VSTAAHDHQRLPLRVLLRLHHHLPQRYRLRSGHGHLQGGPGAGGRGGGDHVLRAAGGAAGGVGQLILHQAGVEEVTEM